MNLLWIEKKIALDISLVLDDVTHNSYILYVRTILPFAPPYSPDNYNTKEYCAIQKVEQFIVYCVMKGSYSTK